MPQIKEYTSNVEPQGPFQTRRAVGEDFGIGGALVYAGQQLNETGKVIEKRQTQQEISDTTVSLSKAHQDYSQYLQESMQQGTLETEAFNSQFSDHLAKIGENLHTDGAKQYFTRASTQLQTHFFEKSMAGQAQLASAKAVADYKTQIDTFSTTAVSNPNDFKTMIDQHHLSLNALVSNGLPDVAAEKLRTTGDSKIADAAIRGAIRLDPADAEKRILAGEWKGYISSDQEKSLLTAVKVQEAANRAGIKRNEAAAKKEYDTVVQKEADGMFDLMERGQLTSNAIMSSPVLPETKGPNSKRAMVSLLERVSNLKQRTENKNLTNQLLQRAYLPPEDPQKLTDETELQGYIGHGLTIESANKIRRAMQGKGTAEGAATDKAFRQVMSAARVSLVGSGGGLKDPAGAEHLNAFYTEASSELEKAKKAGPDAVHALFDPKSPTYLLNRTQKFIRSPQQIISDQIGRMRGTPAAPSSGISPRNPGESAADYLKRTGGR